MAAPFLTLVQIYLGLPFFKFTQWRVLLTDLQRYSSRSESSLINQTKIKPSPTTETTIDPCLELWSLNSPSFGDSESSDVDRELVNPHQSNDDNLNQSQSAKQAGSPEDTANILRGDEHLTTSESPNIGSYDSETLLVINDQLIKYQNVAIKYRREKDSLQRKMDHIEKQIGSAESHIFRLERCEEKTAQVEIDLEHQKEKLRDACERRDKLQWYLNMAKRDYEMARNETQDEFDEIFERAGLLNLPEQDKDSDLSIQRTPEANRSTPSIHSASIFVSMSELFRRGVTEELDHRRRIFHEMEDGFNERYQDLAKGLAEYHHDVQEGLCDMPQSEFDRIALNAFRERTRDFIDAEALLNEVKFRARALGLLHNEWEQESQFVDHDDDGYRESYEASATDGANRDSIEAWSKEVLQSDDVETAGDAETDEWDAESLDMGDSISCVDFSRNGARIDRWRKMCAITDCDDSSSESHDGEIASVNSHDSGT